MVQLRVLSQIVKSPDHQITKSPNSNDVSIGGTMSRIRKLLMGTRMASLLAVLGLGLSGSWIGHAQ